MLRRVGHSVAFHASGFDYLTIPTVPGTNRSNGKGSVGANMSTRELKGIVNRASGQCAASASMSGFRRVVH